MSEAERGSRTAAQGDCSDGRNAFSPCRRPLPGPARKETGSLPPPASGRQCQLALSIEGRTEFEEAGAAGFDRDGEGQSGGIVGKQDGPVEFAFAGATRESKPEGMEEIAATNLESFFKVSHNILEAVGVERLRVEKEEGELADDVAGGVTSEDRVGIRRPHDLRGVIGKDQLKQISEADEIVGMVAE